MFIEPVELRTVNASFVVLRVLLWLLSFLLEIFVPRCFRWFGASWQSMAQLRASEGSGGSGGDGTGEGGGTGGDGGVNRGGDVHDNVAGNAYNEEVAARELAAAPAEQAKSEAAPLEAGGEESSSISAGIGAGVNQSSKTSPSAKRTAKQRKRKGRS